MTDDCDGRSPEERRDPHMQETYPYFVAATPAARRRWDLCMAVAAKLLEDDTSAGQVRSMAVVMFHDSDLPTD